MGRKWTKNWKPTPKWAEAPWSLEEKHDKMIEVLLTGRFPLIELQEYLGIKPTKDQIKGSGKYEHVRGITDLIQLSRLNGWETRVMYIDGESWVFIPQHIMDEENGA